MNMSDYHMWEIDEATGDHWEVIADSQAMGFRPNPFFANDLNEEPVSIVLPWDEYVELIHLAQDGYAKLVQSWIRG